MKEKFVSLIELAKVLNCSTYTLRLYMSRAEFADFRYHDFKNRGMHIKVTPTFIKYFGNFLEKKSQKNIRCYKYYENFLKWTKKPIYEVFKVRY